MASACFDPVLVAVWSLWVTVWSPMVSSGSCVVDWPPSVWVSGTEVVLNDCVCVEGVRGVGGEGVIGESGGK